MTTSAPCAGTPATPDGPAEGVDEALYEHALEWRTREGFSEQERLAAEFAHRFGTEHTKLRDDEEFCRGANEHFSEELRLRCGSVWAAVCCGPSISARPANRPCRAGCSCRV